MKILGIRSEGPGEGDFLIVEMAENEWDAIAKLRITADSIEEWKTLFKQGIDGLGLHGHARNPLKIAVMQHPEEFVDENNNLLAFDVWARQVYRNYLADPRRGRYRPPIARFSHFDTTNYATLIAALRQRYGDETP